MLHIYPNIAYSVYIIIALSHHLGHQAYPAMTKAVNKKQVRRKCTFITTTTSISHNNNNRSTYCWEAVMCLMCLIFTSFLYSPFSTNSIFKRNLVCHLSVFPGSSGLQLLLNCWLRPDLHIKFMRNKGAVHDDGCDRCCWCGECFSIIPRKSSSKEVFRLEKLEISDSTVSVGSTPVFLWSSADASFHKRCLVGIHPHLYVCSAWICEFCYLEKS